jgi:alanine racemase
MTHLAVADDPNHPLNAQQKESFAHICQFFPGVPTSIAASHGVLLGPAYHGDYVRVGLALYGGLDHPALRPVVQVHAPILEVRPVAAGESVGYGATYVASESRRVMTVGFGYADGYLRAFSNRGVAQLTGEDGTVFVLPVIGRVSMDVVTLDTSDVPESVLATTDEVIFYHPDQGGILAASVAAGTIPYELLTSLKSDLGRWVS